MPAPEVRRGNSHVKLEYATHVRLAAKAGERGNLNEARLVAAKLIAAVSDPAAPRELANRTPEVPTERPRQMRRMDRELQSDPL